MKPQIDVLARLRLWQKFALIGLLVAVLVSFPLYQFFLQTEGEIAFADARIAALVPAKAVLKLIQSTQQHRALASEEFSGNTAMAALRAAKQTEVDALLAASEQAFGGTRDPLVDRAREKTRAAWKAIVDRMASRSVDVGAIFSLHWELLAAEFDLMEREVDRSGLSVDPRPVTSFMVRAALTDLPRVTESFAEAGWFGARMLAAPPADAAAAADGERLSWQERAAIHNALAESAQTSALHNLDKAIHEKPSIETRLEKNIQLARQAAQRLARPASSATGDAAAGAELSKRHAEVVEAHFALTNSAVAVLEDELQIGRDALRSHQLTIVASMLVVTALGSLLVWLVVRSVTRPVSRLVDVIQRLKSGEKSVRAGLPGHDEIGQLAGQFDAMMDEREAAEARAARENEDLNNSVLTLLHAVGQLARRDLTAQVPVAEDVTGAVADALNVMTAETASVLGRVTEVAQSVAEVSNHVKSQSDSVLAMSRVGRNEVQLASRELAAASETMTEIAKSAQDCNDAARRAIETTRTALESVGATVDNIGSIRETVRETEKRIKRLGERSQEISGVVSLIRTISERTHILALNAAMHAASAGEAGRGFAVVAGEVQRLAEAAREATSDIATLVHNIQSETADTVVKMNDVITQVVDGSRLAERAGAQMRETEQSTNHLVQMVDRIAKSSEAQARSTEGLKNRAGKIHKTTEMTGSEMQQQAEGTVKLVEFAGKLVEAVSVFRLPASAPRAGRKAVA